MSRPAFSLTDDQARTLLQQVAPILDRYPAGGRDHRPFVREFVRTVHAATGRTFSPVIYRRLLDVYAPGRVPSTSTLEQEKNNLLAELDQETRAGRTLDAGGAGDDLAAVVQRSVEAAIAQRMPPARAGNLAADQMALAQRDFLQARLAETEHALQQSQARAARLAGELQAALAVRDAQQARIAAAETEAARHAQQAASLTHEVGEQRRYAMKAIDEVRGETRAWKERCAALDVALAKSKQLLEVFRQAAYARGAAIPPQLQQEDEHE